MGSDEGLVKVRSGEWTVVKMVHGSKYLSWKSWIIYPHILPKEIYLDRSYQSLHILKLHFWIWNPEIRTSLEHVHHWVKIRPGEGQVWGRSSERQLRWSLGEVKVEKGEGQIWWRWKLGCKLVEGEVQVRGMFGQTKDRSSEGHPGEGCVKTKSIDDQ